MELYRKHLKGFSQKCTVNFLYRFLKKHRFFASLNPNCSKTIKTSGLRKLVLNTSPKGNPKSLEKIFKSVFYFSVFYENFRISEKFFLHLIGNLISKNFCERRKKSGGKILSYSKKMVEKMAKIAIFNSLPNWATGIIFVPPERIFYADSKTGFIFKIGPIGAEQWTIEFWIKRWNAALWLADRCVAGVCRGIEVIYQAVF